MNEKNKKQISRLSFQVLGCYGGTALDKHTTSFLLDDTTLIDGGTILSVLSKKSLAKIQRIFLSHVHLDHVKEIPFFIAAAAAFNRDRPIEIYALEEVIQALDEHLFNGVIWPDFYRLPGAAPLMKYIPVKPEEPVAVDDLTLTLVPVNHTVPCAGMLIEKAGKTLVYSADTTTTDRLWELAAQRDIAVVIAEASFPDDQVEKARVTRHFTPQLLMDDLNKIGRSVPVLVFHLKPEFEDLIKTQVDQLGGKLLVCKQGRSYAF